MTSKTSIALFNYRVYVQHLLQQSDEVGNPVEQWINVRQVWVQLRPTHHYRTSNNVSQDQALPRYRMIARYAIFCDSLTETAKGYSSLDTTKTSPFYKNIWQSPFRLVHKDFTLKPLVYPSIDPSKKWISALVQVVL
jgi:hypothetical protein